MRHLILLILFVVAVPLAAQQIRNEMVVSTEWLSSHLNRVKVIEVGDAVSYSAGHLPGARLVETADLLTRRNGIPDELPSLATLEAVFSRAGVGDRGRIILYSSDPILAVRAWFTLDFLGHGHRAALLDGGFTRWLDEGRSVVSSVPDAQNIPFHARINLAALTRIKVMKDLLRYRQILGSNLVLIDARSPAQFFGDELVGDVARAAHIPGAVNVPWDENFTRGAAPRLLPERELRELYVRAGVTPESTNIAYCRTGVEASLTYFVLRYLGYKATLYDGSYVEWSSDSAAATSAAGPAGHTGASAPFSPETRDR